MSSPEVNDGLREETNLREAGPPTGDANRRSSESHSTVVEPHIYPGNGTAEDPYIVDWDENDPCNPREWSKPRKWLLTFQLAFATWNVSFASSSYTGGLQYMITALHTSQTVANLGISLYVLGFGVGPLIFAPLSEMYGRRIVFLCTCTPYLLLHLGGALATNIQTLVICRFLAGVAGSAPITNGGSQIGDMWSPRERGLATALYSMCTFFGPVSGPIIGGFVSQSFSTGWRIDFWIMFGLSGLVVVFAFLNLAETYPPILLRRRARRLQAESGGRIYYASVHEREDRLTSGVVLLVNLQRPFVFLVKEPIVTCIAIYISIVYATLYAQFVAFPIVFQEHRHFNPGEGGLAFLGIALGEWIAVASTPLQNRLYWRDMKKHGVKVLPEARLYGAIAGAIALPIAMFWFAWTSSPSVPAVVPILSGIPFGLGAMLVMSAFNAYLMDAYSLYCASALATTILLRSVFAAIFPLFSPPMFEALGDQWGSSVFAFLALACVPIPILFFKYGQWVRSKSHYALKTLGLDVPADNVSGSIGGCRDTSPGNPDKGIEHDT